MSVFNSKDFRVQLPLIDLTSLNQEDSIRSNLKFVKMANEGYKSLYPAAVCLYPKYASLLSDHLIHEIRSCVVSTYFPSSQSPLELKVKEIKYLNTTGVDEIDIVIPVGEFLDENYNEVSKELRLIRSHTNKTLKVILETGLLHEPGKIKKASELAIQCGADFLKTSTGKYKVGATPEAVEEMAQVMLTEYQLSGRKVGLKVAGGIRTVDEAATYIDLVRGVLGDEWINPDYFRIGASSLYNNIVA